MVLELEDRGSLRVIRRPLVGAPRVEEAERSQLLDLLVVSPGFEHEFSRAYLALVRPWPAEGLGRARPRGIEWGRHPLGEGVPEDCAATTFVSLPTPLPPHLEEDLALARPFLRALLGVGA